MASHQNSSVTFSRELKLLLHCLSNKAIDPSDISGIDEEKLIDLIQTHRIISQVRTPLAEITSSSLREKLDGIYIANKFVQLNFSAELIKIQKAFSEKNIAHIALKGPALSQEIYGDPSERTSRDLDILIQLDQLDASLETLKELGYELLTKFSTSKQRRAIIQHYHHMELYHTDKNVMLEIHWKLTSPKHGPFSTEMIWSNSTQLPFSGSELRILSRETLIPYLCLHGTLHCFFRLQWLTDLYHLFKQMSLDEIELLHRQIENSSTRISMNVSLALLSEFFGFEIPEKIKIGMNRHSKKMVQISLNEIAENTSLDRKKSRWRTTLLNHKIQYYTSGTRGLINSLFSRNVRPKNWQVFAFPDSVFFLNHVFSRLIWLLGKLKRKSP